MSLHRSQVHIALQKLEKAVQTDAKQSELRKAVTTATIDAIVPEDLEAEAHNILWQPDSPTELTLLKLCPTTKATAIEHEYDRVTAYGGRRRGFGFFGEQSLPRNTTPAFERKVTNVRLLGEMSETFLLASLEKTIRVDGQVGAEAIARNFLMKSVLQKKNFAMYFSDTSTTRLGASGLRFKGLLQQIREGTDGTEGTSPYGSHVIDMEGQPFTIENIRGRIAKVITLFGRINQLIMDPFCRADFEQGMDAAQRLPLPIDARPFMLGQAIGGFMTQGGATFFHTDNQLAPLYAQSQYVAEADDQAPTSAPGVSGSVAPVGGGRTSKFFADDAGDYFWIITEIKNDRESIGKRYPTSGVVSVAADDELTLTITPADTSSDSFKVYRGNSGDADTDAYGIFEVPVPTSGSATAYDDNLYRPNTSTAFALNIRSKSADALAAPSNGQRSTYELAVEKSETFLSMPDRADNTVSLVTLGPAMGVMELATILATTARPMLYSACAMQVRNALQNLAFINIGSTSNS